MVIEINNRIITIDINYHIIKILLSILMKIVVINTSNSNNSNFNTFTNVTISIIISIGVKIENVISLWLVIVII